MKRFGVKGGTKRRCPKENRRGRGGGQLDLRVLSICDRALDSRDKKGEELSERESPEDETLGESTSHFDPPQCREGDCTTTFRWLVVGAGQKKMSCKISALSRHKPVRLNPCGATAGPAAKSVQVLRGLPSQGPHSCPQGPCIALLTGRLILMHFSYKI